jgi:glycosyltransferase involved in cell wall biosynthesis
MNIGIEARWITFEKTGFGNYALNLLRELSNLDSENQYYVYLNREYENQEIFYKDNFTKIILRARPEIYKHIHIPFHIHYKNRSIELFHFLYNAPSVVFNIPFVLTIHDVSYKHVPHMISIRNKLSLSLQLYINAKKAKRIITDSETSKKDIIRFFNVNPENIEVIYLSVDNNFLIKRDEEKKLKISAKYDLPEKYILYVGTFLPHKNLETLIIGFKELNQHYKLSHKLVLAGKKGRNYKKIENLLSQLKMNNDVKIIGFVPDEDLPYIYSLSDLFVFPSLYEGFGLPLLEAMASGVPVLASNSSCLPEIAGDAALYFNPKDSRDLNAKIVSILDNKILSKELISKGFNRVKHFSWKKMTEKTLMLYEDVYNSIN